MTSRRVSARPPPQIRPASLRFVDATNETKLDPSDPGLAQGMRYAARASPRRAPAPGPRAHV
eukprot:4228362-Lingulodinium_polyedra.AAC.1